MIDINDVRAKDYFKALKDKDQKIFKPKDLEDLKDQYFLSRNDGVEKNNLNIAKQLSLLQYKLSILQLGKSLYQDLPTNSDFRQRIINSLAEIGYKLKINENTTVKYINNQFHSYIGQIKNAIEINKLNLVQIKGGDFSFTDVIVAFEMVLDKSISEDLSLAKFISYEKQANKVIQQRQKNKK